MRVRSIVSYTLVLSLGAFSTAAASDDWRARVDALVQPLLDAQLITGLVIGIEDDHSLVVVGYGRTSETDGRVPDGRTVFEIGSISKVLTGALLVDAVQRGERRLDEPVTALLPDGVALQSKGRPITLVDLTGHFSGLPYLPSNFLPSDSANPFLDYGEEKLFAFLHDYILSRAPGESYEYSNLAPGLLGHLLARSTGLTYEQLLRQRVCEPLGLHDTTTRRPEPPTRLAAPHTIDNEPGASWDFAALAGCGAVRSTALDLLRFAAANVDGGTDLRDALRTMHEPRNTVILGFRSVAIAWHVDQKDSSTRIWHNGQTGGYHSFLGVELETRRRVVLLCNTACALLDALAFQLFDVAAGQEGKPLSFEKPVEVEASQLELYSGRYALAPGVVVTVRADQGKLFATITGQSEFRVFPRSATEFFYRVVEASITFVVPEGAQQASRLVLRQNGRDMPAQRLSE